MPVLLYGDDARRQGPMGLGVSIRHQNAQDRPDWYAYVVDLLTPAWWHNWHYDRIDDGGNVPMLWSLDRIKEGALYQEALRLGRLHPHRFWLMGDAPEGSDSQSYSRPASAAATMRSWVRNCSAPFSVGGVTLWGAGLQWLTDYLNADGPVPMAWHGSVLAASVEDWQRVLDTVGRWMERENVVRPLILSETSLYGTTMRRQVPLLTAIANALSQGRIAAAAWFCDYSRLDNVATSSLLNKQKYLSPVGKAFLNVRRVAE